MHTLRVAPGADVSGQRPVRLVMRSLVSFVPGRDALPLAFPTSKLRCPHCRSLRIVGHGRWRGRRRYRCKTCRRTFNALTATPLARLHYPERWLELAVCMIRGLSLRATAQRLGIHVSTAFRWRHRILAALAADGREGGLRPGRAPGTPAVLGGMVPDADDGSGSGPGPAGLDASAPRPLLSGVVEVSEVRFAHSEKGSRRLHRPPRRRGLLWSEPWNVKKVFAVVVRDRRGRILTAVTGIGPPRVDELVRVLAPVAPGSVLCPPRPQAYRRAAARLGLVDGYMTRTRRRPPVRLAHWHREGATALHLRLRAWIHRFHGLATRYLHRYLAWYAFLEQVPLADEAAAGDQLLRATLQW